VIELSLEGPGCRARIVPGEGARVQSLIDRKSDRELLYQRHPGHVPRDEFLICSTGGWDLLFPNDSLWRGFPDHGVVWNAEFAVAARESERVELHAALTEPGVEIAQRISLLPAPRRGLRVATTICARAATGPFLFAHHPALAVGEGWRIEHASQRLSADEEAPGRFPPGTLSHRRRRAAAVLPAPNLGLAEVLYADGLNAAVVRSPDGRYATRVAWNTEALPHLWIVLISGVLGIDLTLLFEPCTSRPYLLDHAIAAGTARSLAVGESFEAWCEVESTDETAA
jgi:galactose mutarotase-like enzyme